MKADRTAVESINIGTHVIDWVTLTTFHNIGMLCSKIYLERSGEREIAIADEQVLRIKLPVCLHLLQGTVPAAEYGSQQCHYKRHGWGEELGY